MRPNRLVEKISRNPEYISIVLRQCSMKFDVLKILLQQKIEADFESLHDGFASYPKKFPEQFRQTCNAAFDKIIGNLSAIVQDSPELQDAQYNLAKNPDSITQQNLFYDALQLSPLFKKHGSSEIPQQDYCSYYAKEVLNTLYKGYVEFSIMDLNDDSCSELSSDKPIADLTMELILAQNGALKIFLRDNPEIPDAIKNNTQNLDTLARSICDYAQELAKYDAEHLELYLYYSKSFIGQSY